MQHGKSGDQTCRARRRANDRAAKIPEYKCKEHLHQAADDAAEKIKPKNVPRANSRFTGRPKKKMASELKMMCIQPACMN